MGAGGHTLQGMAAAPLLRGKELLVVNRQTLLYLSVGAIALIVLAIILGFVNAVIGAILYLLGGLLVFLSWVMGLLMTARAKEWLWFVLVFLFLSLGTLAYSLMGRKQMA